MKKQELKRGQLVQLNPNLVRNKSFAGCIMVVIESKEYGALGYVQALGERNNWKPGGQAYYQAEWQEIEVVGIAKWVSEFLLFREATFADSQMLLEWRNDPITREASHNSTIIEENDHIQWLKKILRSSNRKLFIALIDGIPVGTIRMDSEPNGFELSWTVSPAKRNSGIGKLIVTRFANDIIEPIRAEIKVGNISSIRIAEAIGMILEKEKDGVLYYRRDDVRDRI